jgi:hypothetical protein
VKFLRKGVENKGEMRIQLMRRIILPAALALATVSLTACKTREQAAKRYLEKSGKKPTPALINKYAKLAKSRFWPTFFGYRIEDAPRPEIITRTIKEPCKEPVKIVQPGMTTGTPKPVMKPDPLKKYNKLSLKADLFLDSNARQLKKKRKYRKLKRALKRYEKKKNEKNGEALVKAYDAAREALEKRSGGRRRRPMRNGMKPENGMKQNGMKQNGMKPGMGEIPI